MNERESDPLLLAHAFLDKFNDEFKKNLKGFTQEAVDAINSHSWPGNVRELESKVKRAVILADGKNIIPEDLELEDIETSNLPLNLKQVKDEAESNAVRRALNHHQWNISNTAKGLGVTRPTLYSIMEKHGISESQ